MKNWIKCAAILFLVPQITLAGNFRTRDPQVTRRVQEDGVGAYENIRLARDGSNRQIRIDSYYADPKTGELVVTFTVNNKVIGVQYDDERIVMGPASKDQVIADDQTITVDDPHDSHKHDESTANDGGWSEGVATGGLAALQYILVTDSKANKELNRAYAEIERLQNEMQDMWDKVDAAEVDLSHNVIALDMRIQASASNAQEPVAKVQTGSRQDILAFANRDQSDLKSVRWLSAGDKTFSAEADGVRNTLLNARVDTPVKHAFYDISKESLVRADRENYLGHSDETRFLLDIAKTAANVLVGLDPFTGFVRSTYEVFTGKNLITGAELSTGERVLAGLGVLTSGYTLSGMRAFKAMLPIAQKIAPAAMESFNGIKTFLNETGNGFKLVGEGSEVRKINLRSVRDEAWGFTRKHLNKHFFGDGKLSLSMIDPKGNPDIWMRNIMDVVQRPPVKTLDQGILQIEHLYEKADKSGLYKLGVRLAPNADKSYDLVTILTKQ